MTQRPLAIKARPSEDHEVTPVLTLSIFLLFHILIYLAPHIEMHSGENNRRALHTMAQQKGYSVNPVIKESGYAHQMLYTCTYYLGTFGTQPPIGTPIAGEPQRSKDAAKEDAARMALPVLSLWPRARRTYSLFSAD